MSYATLDDLLKLASETRLIDLTDRAVPPAGTVDVGVVDQALADTAALIDGYLDVRYALPLAPVPAALRRHAAVIAYYLLHVEHVPDKIATDYKDALRWLEQVAAGRIGLSSSGAGEAGGAGSPATEPTVRLEAPPRVFSRTSLRGW